MPVLSVSAVCLLFNLKSVKEIVQGSQSYVFLVCNIVVQIQTQISVLETFV